MAPRLLCLAPCLNRRHGAAWVVVITVFLTYAAFIQPDNPNTTSRLGWILNLMQDGDFSLGGYADLTIDKAVYDGHYYSDKAPGLSLIAGPAIAVFTRFKSISPEDFGSKAWIMMRHFATLSTLGLLSAWTAGLIFSDSLKRSGNLSAALYATALFAIGSPIMGWSTLLFGHAAIASLFVIVTIASEQGLMAGRHIVASVVTASLLGLAVIIEYTSAIPVAILALRLVHQINRSDCSLRYKFKCAWVMMLTGALVITPALIYNWICFGNPLRVGYGYVAGFNEMKSGFFGIGFPDPNVAFALLFGSYRGAIWICPAIVVMGLAMIYAIQRHDTRGLAITALLIFAYYLALNSAYAYWNGGFSTGPRHLVPALALPILVIARIWTDLSKPTKWLAIVLLAQSVMINLAATSVLMLAPSWLENPIFGYILPYFFQNPEWRSVLLINLWILSLLIIRRLIASDRTRPIAW